jgi:hypothetical protein
MGYRDRPLLLTERTREETLREFEWAETHLHKAPSQFA